MRSSGARRAPSCGVLELHVFCVPDDLWNNALNTVSTHAISKFISVGFVRVLPDLSLKALRLQIGNLLGAETVDDKFAFLKCVGRSLAVVRSKQELELKVKSFAPPHAPQPELYILHCAGFIGRRWMSGTLRPGSLQRPRKGSDTYVLHPGLPLDGNESSGGCKSSSCTCHVCVDKGLGRHHDYLTERRPVSSNRDEKNTRGEQNSNRLHLAGSPEMTGNDQHRTSTSGPSENGDLREFKGDDFPQSDVYCAWEHGLPTEKISRPSQPRIMRDRLDERPAQLRKQDSGTEVSSVGPGLMLSHSIPKETRIHSNNTMDSGIPESLDDRDVEYLENQRKKSQQAGRDPGSRSVGQDISQTPGSSGRELDYSLGEKQYSPPPPPPLLTADVQRPHMPTDTEELIAQINAVKQERKSLEKTREELVKKAKSLLSQNRLRQNQVRDSWKKQYFEAKKATGLLEGTTVRLRLELETFYQKLLHQLSARVTRRRLRKLPPTSASKNELIIQITTLKHEIDQLYRRLESAKMKLVTEMKLRKQTLTDLKALRAELAQKKTRSSLNRLHGASTPHGLNILAA
ncbi:spermatogenesis-associated protein 1 [Amblyraja radiata]|uniref:spermatogenesis-associated protein 1 n=1 Tax=Amblyraja radiata TaxID=386614 RepID=UPI001401D548|nr:spermatogenesis-associated protein 1 [Amblyraja radiata]